jgi:steroid delta-isomerase-like uncharacterized protein
MRATLITAACLVMLASASAQERKQTTPMMASAEQTPASATATPTSVTTPIKGSATERGRHAPNGIVGQLFAAWSSHDPDRVVAFYTDGVAYEDVPLGRTSRGKTELRKFVEDTFAAFPDLKVEVVNSSICEGHGVSELVWSATDKGFLKTDKRFSVRMVSVFELHEGKVSRNEDFYDLSAITRQLGALPANKTASTHSDSGEQPLTSDEKALLEIDHAWGETEQKQAPATTAPPPAHEMQRLTNMLAGRWSIGQVFEPRGGMPKGVVGQGTEVWRPGPGSLSLIEELQTRVGDREFSGLGVIWWDTQAQGYRLIWCGSANPRGCVVMSKLAHWEGDQFVVGDEFERDGRKVVYREVFSDVTLDSFTQTIYEGESEGELKRKLTIHAAKVARAALSDPNHENR